MDLFAWPNLGEDMTDIRWSYYYAIPSPVEQRAWIFLSLPDTPGAQELQTSHFYSLQP